MSVTEGSGSSWGSTSTMAWVVAWLAQSAGGRSTASLSSRELASGLPTPLVAATNPGAEVGHGEVPGDVLAITEEWDSG